MKRIKTLLDLLMIEVGHVAWGAGQFYLRLAIKCYEYGTPVGLGSNPYDHVPAPTNDGTSIGSLTPVNAPVKSKDVGGI